MERWTGHTSCPATRAFFLCGIYPSTLASCGHCSSSGVRRPQSYGSSQRNGVTWPPSGGKAGWAKGKHFRCTQSVTPKNFRVFLQSTPGPVHPVRFFARFSLRFLAPATRVERTESGSKQNRDTAEITRTPNHPPPPKTREKWKVGWVCVGSILSSDRAQVSSISFHTIPFHSTTAVRFSHCGECAPIFRLEFIGLVKGQSSTSSSSLSQRKCLSGKLITANCKNG